MLAGDSAGAQISAQVALLATDSNYARQVGIKPDVALKKLKAVMLLSGAYDVGAVDLEGDQGWFLRTVLWAYSGVKDFTNDEQFKLLSVTTINAAFTQRHLKRQ